VQGFYTPFGGLDQHLTKTVREKPPPPAPAQFVSPQSGARTAPPGQETEDEVFRRAMAEVVPLNQEPGKVPAARTPTPPPRFRSLEDEEVHAHLMRLVEGESDFELTYSDEYVDGAVVGLSPKVLRTLRNGDYSYQDYVDLHGLTRAEARETVVSFVTRSFAQKSRCVLIIPGRGLNSEDKQPVLKERLVAWLTQAPLKRLVLAFASARSYDGGAGAFYVLLRRNQKKETFLVPAR
jgi:DNA-nicking Smr family endonuclease